MGPDGLTPLRRFPLEATKEAVIHAIRHQTRSTFPDTPCRITNTVRRGCRRPISGSPEVVEPKGRAPLTHVVPAVDS